MKKIHLIAATRPNFMKVGPLLKEMEKNKEYKITLIHTGQHYDENMSKIFFDELNIRTPDINLNIGGGTHAEQTGKTMIAYEKIILKNKPDLTIVVGDVNATLACALAAKKQHVPVAHVEAGLRSGDMTMPEEINRILTDHISDILLTRSKKENKNLENEGISKNKIKLVGDIMLDSLESVREKIEGKKTYKKYTDNEYVVLTLHRPKNVDNKKNLEELIGMIKKLSEQIHIIFSIHPRTENNLKKEGLFKTLNDFENMSLIPPQGYLDFMNLIFNCKFVVTDSGSIQTETTYLNIPCITIRDNTERPLTIEKGSNVLSKTSDVLKHVEKIMKNKWKKSESIEGWDGKTAERIHNNIKKFLQV